MQPSQRSNISCKRSSLNLDAALALARSRDESEVTFCCKASLLSLMSQAAIQIVIFTSFDAFVIVALFAGDAASHELSSAAVEDPERNVNKKVENATMLPIVAIAEHQFEAYCGNAGVKGFDV
jgi:hypothetical protein